MAFLVNNGYAATTISSTISAIGYVHRMGELEDPTENFKVEKALIGVHRLAKKGDQRLPITLSILHKLLEIVDRTCKESYERIMIKAMYLLMFYGLLRVGEITSKRKADYKKVVNHKEVKLFTKGTRLSSLSLNMNDFKHNLPTNTVTIKIAGTGTQFCPVTHMLAYLVKRGANEGPLFLNSHGKPVSTSYFSAIFRATVVAAGLDPARYKPHCFRIGGTTRYAELGYEDSVIQRMGRWKSPAFKRYVRMASYGQARR